MGLRDICLANIFSLYVIGLGTLATFGVLHRCKGGLKRMTDSRAVAERPKEGEKKKARSVGTGEQRGCAREGRSGECTQRERTGGEKGKAGREVCMANFMSGTAS